MGARHKINEIHFLGIFLVSACAGIVFASIEMAILFGIILSCALVAGGGIRMTSDALFSRPAAKAAQQAPQRSRHRRRR